MSCGPVMGDCWKLQLMRAVLEAGRSLAGSSAVIPPEIVTTVCQQTHNENACWPTSTLLCGKALFSFQVISSPHNAVLRQIVVFEAYTLATQLGLSMFARRYYTFK